EDLRRPACEHDDAGAELTGGNLQVRAVADDRHGHLPSVRFAIAFLRATASDGFLGIVRIAAMSRRRAKCIVGIAGGRRARRDLSKRARSAMLMRADPHEGLNDG